MKTIVGGGSKKVLYTLSTVKRIGLKQSAKALRANNTCKACGLGMGGQLGGMTNELGEFPSVCNKSIQAQSTDIQPPIPTEIFQHSLSDLRELSAHELEHLGRLGEPVFKAKDGTHYQPVSWSWALAYAAKQFASVPADNTFFYSSGRSSNEAGFLLQLLARAYGTNNVNNCSYYCHQATSVGLGSTIGTGTATVELEDLSLCDCIFVIGANPASNHPRFIHQLKACRDRGGQVIVINPAKEPGLVKFAVPKSPKSMIAGGTEIASLYIQPKIGGDLALFKGIAKALFEQASTTAVDGEFIDKYCEDFEPYKADIMATEWPEIEALSGVCEAQIRTLADAYCLARSAVFAWGMGMTHHRGGVQNVEAIANLALLRGMVGRPGAGLLPLRGHSNVQGIGTIGVKPVLADEVLANMEKAFGAALPVRKGLDTLHALKAAASGHIQCACIVGGNLFSASPDSTWVEAALDKINFKLFLTTTLNAGHVHGVDSSEALVLPVLARDEEAQATTQESMFNFVRLSDGGIERIANARSEVDVLASLAELLLPKSPIPFAGFKNHQHLREAIADIVPGMEALRDIGIAKKEFHVKNRLMHSPVFNRSSGKAAFVVHILARSLSSEEFPFLLASVRSEGQFNSIIYEEYDSYRYNAGRRALLLCPDDMASLSIRNGDLLDVRSRVGELKKMTAQAFDIPPGNVLAYYPEANVLISQDFDPQSLTPAFKSVPVAIRKCQ
ncbi:MAG TPA: FdhF/YdeP family oxidoreductase [Marinagarivorans sp.]